MSAELPFEKEIRELEAVLAKLESMADEQGGTNEEIRRIRREITNLTPGTPCLFLAIPIGRKRPITLP
jgi:hypothetical protein